MRGILTQALVVAVLATGVEAGSPSAAPGKAPNNASTAARRTVATGKSPTVKLSAKRAYQVGDASWYGRQFHGRKTASGEAFDMYQLTAAHRTLPLGSW